MLAAGLALAAAPACRPGARAESQSAMPSPTPASAPQPLLYTLGAAGRDKPASFPIEGFDHSLSMRSVRLA